MLLCSAKNDPNLDCTGNFQCLDLIQVPVNFQSLVLAQVSMSDYLTAANERVTVSEVPLSRRSEL